MRMILHGSDIGNPALNFQLATVWSLKIIQEFNLQVWKEEQLGLPISEFMRIGNDIGKVKRSQIVFIDLFIYPLWKSINDFVPNTSDLVENIQKNRKHWEDLENL
jgi:3'5'-cyclic nucleotide phosphodiesterase